MQFTKYFVLMLSFSILSTVLSQNISAAPDSNVNYPSLGDLQERLVCRGDNFEQ